VLLVAEEHVLVHVELQLFAKVHSHRICLDLACTYLVDKAGDCRLRKNLQHQANVDHIHIALQRCNLNQFVSE